MATLLRVALSCVLLVIFRLLSMATAVTAPLVANVSRSVSSAEQEPLLTDELLAAVQEIARALKRNVELLTNNSSLMKVARFTTRVLLGIEILKIFTGVLTQYLVDYLRKTGPHWNSQMPPALKDELETFIAFAEKAAEALDRIATASERQAAVMENLRSDVANRPADVANLQAQLKDELEPFLQHLAACAEKEAEALDRMASSTLYAERQLAAYVKEAEDLRTDMATIPDDVANLQAQLDAMREADAERKEKKMKRKVELIEEWLKDGELHRDDVLPDTIEGFEGVYRTDAEASKWASTFLTDS